MLRSLRDAKLTHLLVGNCCHALAFYQWLPLLIDGAQQPEWTVADAAHYSIRLPGFGDFAPKNFGKAKVIGRAPSASQINDVVLREVEIVDLERPLDLALQASVAMEALVGGRLDEPPKRLWIDRNLAALHACQVDHHAAF